MVAVGEPAPDFEAPASTGGVLRLSQFRGRPLVLYFFPKAFTYGCTIETEGFVQEFPQLQAKGVQVVGVSVDNLETQTAFANECHAVFPLVADSSKEVARRYGALGILGVPRRVTYLIDANGIVRDIVESIRPGPHLRASLEKIISQPPGA
jgi:thioredoxin-dependent peroxiredoxin